MDSRARALLESPWIQILVPVVLFARELAGFGLIAPNDAFHDYLPWHIVVARIWRSGRIPVWNPFVFSGFPLLAVGHAGVLYPPNALFLVLPAVLANNLYVVLHFVIAGLGARALAQELYGDKTAAGVGGIAFGLTGFLFAHIGHQDILAAAAWLPWSLYGFERFRERPSWSRLLGAAGPLAMSFLAGHFQIFALNVLVLGLYAFTLTLFEAKRDRARSVVGAGVVSLVALGIAAVQLLPTLHVIGGSVRSAITYESATTYAFPKSHLVTLMFPYLFGGFQSGPFMHHYSGVWNLYELSGYPGAAALLIAGVGISHVWRDRRSIALVVAATVCFVFALGASTPAGRLLYLVPVFRNFRAWARYMLAFDLAVAMLAARGVALLRSSTQDGQVHQRRALLVLLSLGVAAVVLPLLPQIRRFIPGAEPSLWALALPLAAAATAALLLSRIRASNIAACGLAVLIALDLTFSFGWWHDWRTGSPSVASFSQRVSSPSTDWGSVPSSPGGITRFLYASADPVRIEPSFPDVTDAQGLYSTNGNDSLAPRDYLDAVGKMSSFGGAGAPGDLFRRESHVLDLLRVSVVLQDGRDAPPGRGSQLTRRRLVAGGRLARYEHAPTIPEYSLVGSAIAMSRAGVLSALRGDRPFDPRRTVLLERPCADCGSVTSGGAGSVRLRSRRHGEIRFEVRASRTAWLLVSQAWFPEWKATVDGRSSPVLRADGLVQAVGVRAGHHLVRLRYTAPGLDVGAAISAAVLLLLGFGVVLEKRKQRAGAAHP